MEPLHCNKLNITYVVIFKMLSAHKEAKGLSLELHVGELISLLSAVRREVTTGLHDVFPRSQPPIDSTKKTQPFIANNGKIGDPVNDCGISNVLAMEIRQSYTKPW